VLFDLECGEVKVTSK